MRLFLYGTLLDRMTLAQRGGSPAAGSRQSVATLRGWQRVALPQARWPTLRRRHGSRVAGIIVDLHADAVRRLAAYEGSAYRLTPVTVTTPNGSTTAHVWIAPGGTRRPWKE